MSEWICEDVGLVINEIREKLDAKIKEFSDYTTKPENILAFLDIVGGMMLAKSIVDEVANNWTSDEPPQYVLDKVRLKENK